MFANTDTWTINQMWGFSRNIQSAEQVSYDYRGKHESLEFFYDVYFTEDASLVFRLRIRDCVRGGKFSI